MLQGRALSKLGAKLWMTAWHHYLDQHRLRAMSFIGERLTLALAVPAIRRALELT